MTTRREFLRAAGMAGVASGAARLPLSADVADSAWTQEDVLRPLSGPLQEVARDERYWRRVASRYPMRRSPVNLEAGYWGVMASPVLAVFQRNVERVNRSGAVFARREYPGHMEAARARVAAFVGASPTEVLLTRGATESLQALIGQYRHVRAGDVLMYADLDYASMQLAMNALAGRTGATIVTINLPEPVSREAILDTYRRAFEAHPRTRLLLLTHCNNKTGLLHPIREIIALARERGIDAIVDAAHSFGQVPLTMDDLGADFVGFNLHKWIGAPVGAGALYIRSSRLDAITNAHGDETPLDRIDGRVHTGTTDFATVMTIPAAIDFQESIGLSQKAARLRYLRDRWVAAVRDLPEIEVLTPDDPGMVGAITGFRLRGRGSRDENIALARALLDEFDIFTVQRTGIARGDCVRVTPALHNLPADCDRLASALRTLATRA